MPQIHCINCSAIFEQIPQVPNQLYCSKEKCQKERKRQWQEKKRKVDKDYKENQYRAQKAWAERNPNYWREYRKKSSIAQQKNRPSNASSMDRHKTQKNIDESKLNSIEDGIFHLRVIDKPNGKMDAWIIELVKYKERYHNEN